MAVAVKSEVSLVCLLCTADSALLVVHTRSTAGPRSKEIAFSLEMKLVLPRARWVKQMPVARLAEVRIRNR